MLAQRLEAQAPIESRPLRAVEIPRPEPGPGQIRIRVTACGVCRTDLHVIEGDLRAANLPLVPGHQVVGVVDALGAGASRYRPGDRVGIAWLARHMRRVRPPARRGARTCAVGRSTRGITGTADTPKRR